MEAKRSLFIPQIRKNEAKRSLFIPQIRKIEAERTRLITEIGKIEGIEVKRREAVFFKLLWSPGIDSEELIGRPVQQPYSSSIPSLLRLF
jgi:hypothetical protein